MEVTELPEALSAHCPYCGQDGLIVEDELILKATLGVELTCPFCKVGTLELIAVNGIRERTPDRYWPLTETGDLWDSWCDYCKKQYKTVRGLNNHVISKHPGTYAFASLIYSQQLEAAASKEQP